MASIRTQGRIARLVAGPACLRARACEPQACSGGRERAQGDAAHRDGILQRELLHSVFVEHLVLPESLAPLLVGGRCNHE